MNDAPLSPHHLSLLARANSPTVANVIELFGIRSQVAGYMNHHIRAVYPEMPPIVGFAATASFRAGYPAEGGASYAGMPEMIEQSAEIATPRIAVFQDLDEPVRAATYGEVMATTFKAFGFVGLVTSGAARDIEQVRPLQFPCWASSVIVSHGYPQLADIGAPVTVGGLRIASGDLLHADANGILQIPLEIAETVAELCGPYMDAERLVLDYVSGGSPTTAGYRAAVGAMKAELAALAERARAALAPLTKVE